MGLQTRRRAATGNSPADRLDRRLARAPWLVTGIGLVLILLVPGSRTNGIPDSVVIPVLVSFFVALIARLVAAAVAATRRDQAFARLALAVGLVMWLIGSASLNSGGAPTSHFPAPGEVMFLIAYAGLALFIMLDVRANATGSRGRALEAVVACGGAICAAGLLMASPLADDFSRQGVPLLVALLYPLLDLSLVTIVLGQLVLRMRPLSRRTATLVGGFLLIGIADVTLVRNVSRGTYDYGIALSLCWFLGFLLLVAGACRRESDAPVRTSGDLGVAMVVPGTIAILALAFQPTQGGEFVVVPALVTLFAAGARMVQALSEARGAAEAFRLSRTDDLTGLLNRRGMTAKIDARITGKLPLGLVLADLDGFKEINDSLGHEAGDAMLRLVATRLRGAFGKEVSICRLGGDEYALAFPEGDPDELLHRARGVLDLVRTPATVDGVDLVVSASVGLTVRTEDDRDFGDLLRRADVAMYQAKSERAGVMLYAADRDHFSKARLSLADELRRGIEHGDLVVHYQPQVGATSGSLTGVEALVRWQHPENGLLPPGEFLPIARRTGLMGALTEYVMETMVADLKRWADQGLAVYASLNVAPPELLGGPVLKRLYALLDATGLPASRVVVEITEDSLLTDPERARTVLQEIHDRGVQVSIDDFGTGFSSLAYLRALLVQELKIDRVFVSSILTDPRARMIVESVNHLAHGLEMHTVAEGVEDDGTGQLLAAIGVDILQGYYYFEHPGELLRLGGDAQARRRRGTRGDEGRPVLDAVQVAQRVPGGGQREGPALRRRRIQDSGTPPEVGQRIDRNRRPHRLTGNHRGPPSRRHCLTPTRDMLPSAGVESVSGLPYEAQNGGDDRTDGRRPGPVPARPVRRPLRSRLGLRGGRAQDVRALLQPAAGPGRRLDPGHRGPAGTGRRLRAGCRIPAYGLRNVQLAAQSLEDRIDAGETFDVVIASHLLDRVPSPVLALKALTELVAPGGILVLSCAFNYQDRDQWEELREPTGIAALLRASSMGIEDFDDDVPYREQVDDHGNSTEHRVLLLRARKEGGAPTHTPPSRAA